MAKSLLALLFLTLYYTSCANAGYAINYPGTGDILLPGYQYNATWTLTKDTPTEPLVNVALVNGRPENLQPVIPLCSDIKPEALSM